MPKIKLVSNFKSIYNQVMDILNDPLSVDMDEIENAYKDRLFNEGLGEDGKSVAKDDTPLSTTGSLKDSISFSKSIDEIVVSVIHYSADLEAKRGPIFGPSDKEIDIISKSLEDKFNNI